MSGILTILFWNPEHWEMRTSARRLYDTLRRHDTPESAPGTLARMYSEPAMWCAEPGFRSAVSSFLHRSARAEQGAAEEVVSVLRRGSAAADGAAPQLFPKGICRLVVDQTGPGVCRHLPTGESLNVQGS